MPWPFQLADPAKLQPAIEAAKKAGVAGPTIEAAEAKLAEAVEQERAAAEKAAAERAAAERAAAERAASERAAVEKAAAVEAAANRLAVVEYQENILVETMVHLKSEQAIIEQFQLLTQQNILRKKVN